MADPAMMNGIGSFAQAFLEARRVKIAQQQADAASATQGLEQQKYEFSKQQQAVLNAQKQQEIDQTEEDNLSQHGSGGYEYMQALKNRATSPQSQAQPATPPVDPNQPAPTDNQDSSGNSAGIPSSQDWANAMGAGVLSKPPGSGFVAPPTAQAQSPSGGSPYSTLPRANAQANPGAQQPPQAQAGPNGLPPSVTPQWMKQAASAAKYAQIKNVQDQADSINSKKGHADVVFNPDGSAKIDQSTLDLGPEANESIVNSKTNGRSAFGAGVERVNSLSSAHDNEKSVAAATGMAVPVGQAYKAFTEGGPNADETMASTLAQMEGEKTGDPQKVVDSGSASQALKDYIANKFSGGVTDITRQNMIREIQSNMQARASAAAAVAPKYIAKAKAAGVDPSTIVSNPDVDGIVKQGQQLVGSFPKQTPRGQQPGFLGGLGNYAMGLVNGSPNPTMQSSQQDPQILKYAQQYKLDYPHAEQILKARGYGK